MRRSRCRASVIAAVAAVLLPTSGYASGRLPIPASTQRFASSQACLAALEGFHEQDQRQIAPKKRAPNGDTREVDLDTKGIEHLGPDHARYEATIWYHSGRFRADFQQTETSHTFERRLRECDGKTLHISGENGFTMSTLDP